MKRDGWTYGVVFVLLAVGAGWAQTESAPTTWDPSASQYPHQSAAPQTDPDVPESEPAPALWNGYEVHGSAEFGGRGVSSSGDLGLYSTYVNLGSGPRLLDQSIEMHSVNHNGFLFDDLSDEQLRIWRRPE